MDPVSGLVTGTLEPGFAAGAPVWQLGRWGSATSLGDLSPVVLPSGAQSWSDAYGGLNIGTTGTADADLSLHVNANAEYGGVYRTVDATVTWPHLLGEQRLSAPGQAGPGCPSLNTLDTLQFSLDAKLLYDNRNLGPGFDAGRHAGQYLIYFTAQNLGNPASAGHGDYLWFGVTVYDDRDPMPTLYVAGDDATGKLIYNIGLAPLTAQSLTDNTSQMQVFWSLASSPGFSEAQSAWIDIRNDGVLDTYSIDLSAQPTWTGTVDQLRIDPITEGSGQDLAIDAVVLSP